MSLREICKRNFSKGRSIRNRPTLEGQYAKSSQQLWAKPVTTEFFSNPTEKKP